MQCNNSEKNDLPINSYELWWLLGRATETISRVRNVELFNYGVTREQALVLHLLNNFGGSSTLNQLSTTALRQHNSMSTLIRRMAKLGLIKREKTANDRQYKIVMTPKGQRIFDEMPLTSIDMTFSTLTEEERKLLNGLLSRLECRARNLLGVDYKPPFLP